MKELFVAEQPRPTPTLTASNPPVAAAPASATATSEPAKVPNKNDDSMSNPAYIIVPSVLGGIFCLYLFYSLIKYFSENRTR